MCHDGEAGDRKQEVCTGPDANVHEIAYADDGQ